MATCNACGRTVIAGQLGTETILLDMGPHTFNAVREDLLVLPTDGVALVHSHALVEHSAVCSRRASPQQQGRRA